MRNFIPSFLVAAIFAASVAAHPVETRNALPEARPIGAFSGAIMGAIAGHEYKKHKEEKEKEKEEEEAKAKATET